MKKLIGLLSTGLIVSGLLYAYIRDDESVVSMEEIQVQSVEINEKEEVVLQFAEPINISSYMAGSSPREETLELILYRGDNEDIDSVTEIEIPISSFEDSDIHQIEINGEDSTEFKVVEFSE